MFITLSSTIHQIIMIAVIMLLLFLSIINPLVHGQEILNTIVEDGQVADNNEVAGLFSSTISEDVSNTAAGVGSFDGDGYDTTSAGVRYTPINGKSNNNVAGGLHNAASDSIRRKLYNDDSGDQAFIGLGTNNVATGAQSVIGGGTYNIANTTFSSILGGYGNVASGSSSTVGGGEYNKAYEYYSTISGGNLNTASGFYSTVGGGYDNIASGDGSFVGGGDGNTANGDNSIAMGKNAKAVTDQSCVINVLPGKVASSTKVGEFLVSSKSFTIRIGSKKVTIDKNNIKNFKKLLKGPGRRLKQIDEQKEIIKELQQQNNKQQGQIDEQQSINKELQLINEEQQSINEELHEKMEKLHHMITGSSSNNNNPN